MYFTQISWVIPEVFIPLVNKLVEDNTTDGVVTYTDAIIDIAYDLADSSTNQRQALIHYLREYSVGENVHDEAFYEYIVENYAEIVKQ